MCRIAQAARKGKDMQDYKYWIVDTAHMSAYTYARTKKDAQDGLRRAIEAKKEEARTWESHIRNYPDRAEAFTAYLKAANEATYEIMTWEEFKQRERDFILSDSVQEITEERYDEQLNVLPPLKWCTRRGIEMFCMSEMYTGTYTNQYADTHTGKFYTKMVDICDESTWIHNFI